MKGVILWYRDSDTAKIGEVELKHSKKYIRRWLSRRDWHAKEHKRGVWAEPVQLKDGFDCASLYDSMSQLWRFGPRSVNNHHFVNLRFDLSPFKSFVRYHTSGAHIKFEETHPTNVAAVTTVAAKPSTTTIAHPKGGFAALILCQHAIIVYMVTGININDGH